MAQNHPADTARIEIWLPLEIVQVIEKKASKKNLKRKVFIENLIIDSTEAKGKIVKLQSKKA